MHYRFNYLTRMTRGTQLTELEAEFQAWRRATFFHLLSPFCNLRHGHRPTPPQNHAWRLYYDFHRVTGQQFQHFPLIFSINLHLFTGLISSFFPVSIKEKVWFAKNMSQRISLSTHRHYVCTISHETILGDKARWVMPSRSRKFSYIPICGRSSAPYNFIESTDSTSVEHDTLLSAQSFISDSTTVAET